MSEARIDDADRTDAYLDMALSLGRPTEPCKCQACDCDLHTYPGDLGCVWCYDGQHATDAGREWPTADLASIQWPTLLVGAGALLTIGLVLLLTNDGTIAKTAGGAAALAGGFFVAAARDRSRSA